MAGLILTPEWTEEIYQLETSDPVMGGPDGIDNRQAIQLGKRTEYLKQEVEKRALSQSPKFTGIPTAPTASVGTKNQQLATTQFVANAIAALVGSAPATLDTLAEIAAALGADANLKETLLAEIAKKATATEFNALKNLLIGIPFPYPLAAVPDGCLAMNGQAFSKTVYPELAKKYPSGVLPDLRGEFIRGWDNGRGFDSGRSILSSQGDAKKQTSFEFSAMDIANSSNAKLSGEGKTDTLQWSKDGEHDGVAGWSNRNVGKFNSYAGINPKAGTSGYPQQINDMVYQFWVGNGTETRPRNIAFQYICLAK